MSLLGDEHRQGFLVTSEPFRGRASAEAAGFTVVTYPRAHSQKEKCVDTRFAVEAVLHGASRENPCTYVLVTGDYDQLPTVEALRAQGHLVVTAFWSHGSPQLREASDVFVSLDGHWDALRYHGT